MTQRITLKIKGMECPNCAMTLEGIEDRMIGILQAEASYHKAQMVVAYNETQVTVDEIMADLKRLGYEVLSFSTTNL